MNKTPSNNNKNANNITDESDNRSPSEALSNWASLFEKIILLLTTSIILTVIIYYISLAYNSEGITIEHFEVPPTVEEKFGVTGKTVSQMLLAEITRIRLNAKLKRKTSPLNIDLETDKITATIPGTSFDVNSIILALNTNRKSVSGALVEKPCTPKKFNNVCIFIQITGRPGYITSAVTITNISKAVNEAAIYIYRNYQAYTYAAFLLHTAPKDARKEIKNIINGNYIGNKMMASMGMGFLSATEDGNYTKALDWYNKALEYDPEYVSALLGKGISLGNLGRTKQAIVVLDKALDFEPINPDLLNAKANILEAIGEKDKAKRIYKTAMSFDSNHIQSLTNYARILNSEKRYQASMEILNKAFLDISDDPHVFSIRAVSFFGLFCYESAEKEFRRALQLNHPRPKEIHLKLAETLLELGRKDEVQHECELAQQIQ